MRIVVRSGARVRCTTPRGTVRRTTASFTEVSVWSNHGSCAANVPPRASRPEVVDDRACDADNVS